MTDVFDALGIVRWQRNDATADEMAAAHQQQGGSAPFFDADEAGVVWCVGEELMDCWESPQDPRWRLLLAMAAALGVAPDALQPAEPDDVQAGMRVWALGLALPFAPALPSLSDMLRDGGAKRRAWQLLCAQAGTVSTEADARS